MPTTVAIVEDDAEICEHLEQVIRDDPSFSCICVCRNSRTALARIPETAPEIVIMDLNLPDGSGIDCTWKLKQLMPAAQIVVFTVHDDHDRLFKALEAGATGYLLKRTKSSALLQALRELRDGGAPMTGEIARKVIQHFRRSAPQPDVVTLTVREEEIVRLLAEGSLSKEIADRLSISVATVNSHLRNIYAKLNVRTRTEAVIKYLR